MTPRHITWSALLTVHLVYMQAKLHVHVCRCTQASASQQGRKFSLSPHEGVHAHLAACSQPSLPGAQERTSTKGFVVVLLSCPRDSAPSPQEEDQV